MACRLQNSAVMTRERLRETRPVTILLVEHDERHARSLIRIIGDRGYASVHARTGSSALRNMRIRPFDAVVCDLHLPDASGVDVLKVARAHNPKVALVLMGGCATDP